MTHVIAEANEMIEQLGWIRVYAVGMNADNWLDVRDRIIRQLDRAGDGELTLPKEPK